MPRPGPYGLGRGVLRSSDIEGNPGPGSETIQGGDKLLPALRNCLGLYDPTFSVIRESRYVEDLDTAVTTTRLMQRPAQQRLCRTGVINDDQYR
jgi:hypothetical protein